MNKEMIIVLDFGGQYNQLIARRVRECNVYAEVHPYTLSLDKIKEMNPKGIIFTGIQIVCMARSHHAIRRKYLIWEFRFSESVMARS